LYIALAKLLEALGIRLLKLYARLDRLSLLRPSLAFDELHDRQFWDGLRSEIQSPLDIIDLVI